MLWDSNVFSEGTVPAVFIGSDSENHPVVTEIVHPPGTVPIVKRIDGRIEGYPVTGLPIGNRGPGSLDNSGGFMAHNQRRPASSAAAVHAMHITASVFINDDEAGLHQDYRRWLEGLAPFDASPQRYAHNRTGEDNADAHHKRQIMGREVVVAITAGKLDFGPWEQIFYGEFDGKRNKRILIKII